MERIIEEIKSTAGKVVKKSGELVELSKIKLAISTTNAEISANYKLLGELVYLGQKEEAEADSEKIAETIEKIDALCEKLSSLEATLAELKNEKICPNCGKSNPLDQRYCGNCGMHFETSSDAEVISDVEIL